MFSFEGIEPVPDEIVQRSRLQKAMLFELAMVRAESLLEGVDEPDWGDCLKAASERQRRHYDAKIPDKLEQCDMDIAIQAARNLVGMLSSVQNQNPGNRLEKSPVVPGLGWIASGVGDFAFGNILVEVKHTDRNFVAGDYRQVLMYWILKYASAIENKGDVWSNVLLLNPRRNAALAVSFDYLLRSTSASSDRVELLELLRSIVCQGADRP